MCVDLWFVYWFIQRVFGFCVRMPMAWAGGKAGWNWPILWFRWIFLDLKETTSKQKAQISLYYHRKIRSHHNYCCCAFHQWTTHHFFFLVWANKIVRSNLERMYNSRCWIHKELHVMLLLKIENFYQFIAWFHIYRFCHATLCSFSTREKLKMKLNTK